MNLCDTVRVLLKTVYASINCISSYIAPVKRDSLVNEWCIALILMVVNMSKAPENTESNYSVLPSVLAPGTGFVHSRYYETFSPSLRLSFDLCGLEWFMMWCLNSEEWMEAVRGWATLYGRNSLCWWSQIFLLLNVLKDHMAFLHGNGLFSFVSSIFENKNSLFQFMYSMHAYDLCSVFWRFVGDFVL